MRFQISRKEWYRESGLRWPTIEGGRVTLVEGEIEMKSTNLGTFLLGVSFGIGITILALYAQKPGRLATSMETIADMRRTRRAKEEETTCREKG